MKDLYGILSDEKKRVEYDRQRARGPVTGIFGVDFEDLVTKVKSDGISEANCSELFDDFIAVAKNFHDNAPVKLKETADAVAADPGSMMGLLDELFGLKIEVPGKGMKTKPK